MPSQKPSNRADAVLALSCQSIHSSLLNIRQNAKKRAVAAVARNLGVPLHRLWVSRQVYEPLRNSQKAAWPWPKKFGPEEPSSAAQSR
jgi:hypothetical protein